MSAPDDIRVTLLEPVTKTRKALAELIDGSPGFRVVDQLGSVADAVASIDCNPPDVVVLGAEGDAARQTLALKTRFPALPLLVLSPSADEAEVADCVCNGASGYLLRETPPARLLEALRELSDGGAPMSPRVAGIVVASLRRLAARPSPSAPTPLTRREIETLKLLADGHSYKTAAAALGLSIDTVRFHVRNIYEKLHVHSKVEAVLKATREGTLPSDR